MLQIIFKNFPYKHNNNRHGVHVWNYNSTTKPLLWFDIHLNLFGKPVLRE